MADDVDIRVRLRDSRRFIGEATGVSRAVQGIGNSAAQADRQAASASRTMSSRLGGGFAILARGAGMAATAFGAAGAAGLGMGLKFNASMETNVTAFSNFLGSTEKAEAHLDRLYGMAAKTPFEFPDLVAGSRRLLAFGMSARESNKWLGTIGDTVAGIGGGTEEINRMVAAVGQIQAKGKASTEEMLQLAELGIPAFEALAKGTGRTQTQVFDDLSAGAISSQEALGALRGHLKDAFGGASAKQAGTFSGQLSTLKDNFTQLLGKGAKPLFEWLRVKALPALNDLVNGMQNGTGTGGKLLDFLSGAGRGIAGAFKLAATGVGTAVGAIRGFIQRNRSDIDGLIRAFRNIATGVKWVFMTIVLPVIRRALPGIKQMFQGIIRMAGGLVKFFTGVFTGDIGKAWDGVKDIFSGALKAIGGILRAATAPFRATAAAIGKAVKGGFMTIVKGIAGAIKGVFNTLIDSINSAIDVINSVTPGKISIPGPAPDIPGVPDIPNIPRLALGGNVTHTGAALVGDAGPEIVRLPRGARVVPLQGSGALAGAAAGGNVRIEVPVYLDRRKIAEAVGDYTRGRLESRGAPA